MQHKNGNPAACVHSKGRSMTNMDSRTLAVYSSCPNKSKRRSSKHSFLDDINLCESCDKVQVKKGRSI